MILHAIFMEYSLTIRADWVNMDLTVLCTGGSLPHVGGCAMAVSYDRPSGRAAAVSALSAPGHQDAVLAAAMAKRLCKRLDCTVFVQCGIHYDDLSPRDLQALQDQIFLLCDQVEEAP